MNKGHGIKLMIDAGLTWSSRCSENAIRHASRGFYAGTILIEKPPADPVERAGEANVEAEDTG